MCLRICFFSFFLLTNYYLAAQQLVNSDYGAYIKKYKGIAIREMQLYKIPASITLAQGMIESGCGKSVLARNTNNHFGIKCQNDWKGDIYRYDDDAKDECFRKYNNVDESFRDHSIFLTTRNRYASLFSLSLNDYKGWAFGLKKAGYATNPDYPNMLIRLIEANKLHLFDDASINQEEITINEPITGKTEKKENKERKQTIKKIYVPETKLLNNEGRIVFRNSYKMPSPSDFDILYTSEMGRKVYQNYGVPFIFAKEGDSWLNVAKEFGIFTFHVFRQNDLLENDHIAPGQMLYLESKKRKNPEKVYKVKKGDSMYSISQEKCIRLQHLLKYNRLHTGDEPKPGSEIKLSR